MSVSLVQKNGSVSIGTQNATMPAWGSGTTAGNLLLVVVNETSATNGTWPTHPSGYTAVSGTPFMYYSPDSAAYGIYWKIAAGGDATPGAVGESSGTSNWVVYTYEFSSTTGWETTPIDGSHHSAADPSSGTSLASGATATLAQSDELAIAVTAAEVVVSSLSYSSNSYTTAQPTTNSGRLWFGWQETGSTAAQQTTASWTTSTYAGVWVATFKTAPAAAGNITTQYLTGFEHGCLSANGTGLFSSIIGAAFTAATSGARSGLYCAHLVRPAATAEALLAPSLGAGDVYALERVAINVSTLPASGSEIIKYGGAGGAIYNMTVSSAGVLALQTGSGTAVTGPTISTGYHLYEFQINLSANTWVINWKVDGVLQTAATYNNGAASNIQYCCLGTYAASGVTYTADYDDWIIGSWVAASDWYGDGRVIAQIAGSDGTHNLGSNIFAPGDAGTYYSGTVTTANTMVDDPPATDGWTTTRSTTDNIAQRATGTTNYMEIAPVTISQAGYANEVRAVLSYSASGTTANTAGCIARNSAGTATVIWGDLPTAQGGNNGALADYSENPNNFFKGAIVTKPAAGWSSSEINAVRWRFGGSNNVVTVPTVQALMLEVDWPVVSQSSSVLYFDGNYDWVRSAGTVPSFSGAFTIAAIINIDNSAVTLRAILGGATSGLVKSFTFSVWPSSPSVEFWNAVPQGAGGPSLNFTDDWLVVLTRPAGTSGASTPRFHVKNLTTGAAMSHTNGGAAVDNPASCTGGYVKIGNYDGTPGNPGSGENSFLGNIAAVAAWDGINMNDAQAEELAANLRTSDWIKHSAGAPNFCVELTSASPSELNNLGPSSWTVAGATDTGISPPWTFDGYKYPIPSGSVGWIRG